MIYPPKKPGLIRPTLPGLILPGAEGLVPGSRRGLMAHRGMMGAAGGAAAGATIIFADLVGSETNLTTYTFSSADIGALTDPGTGEARTHVMMSISSSIGGPASVSTATVGGTSSSLLVARDDGAAYTNEMWICPRTTGTAEDIVVTWSKGVGRCVVVVWAVYNSDGVADDTMSDVNVTQPFGGTMNCPAGGVIGAGTIGFSVPAITTTFTNLNTDVDGQPATGNWSGGSANFATQQTGITVDASGSPAYTADSIIVAASLGPA